MIRQEYSLTLTQLHKLLDARKDHPNSLDTPAWQELGIELGFDSATVLPSASGGKFFTAISTINKD